MSAIKFTAIAIAFFASSTAYAGDQVSFSFDRDELRSSRSISALYERMDRAAENACDSNSKLTLQSLKAERACHAQLINSFVEQVDNPALSTVHEDHHASNRVARLN